MIYSALAALLLLGDDLSRVDVPGVLAFVKSLQLPSGGFVADNLLSDSDLRFTFCVASIGRILGALDIDLELAISHVLACQTHEGGFAYDTCDEAHGAATYCAIAALHLWGAVDRIADPESLAMWFLTRQGAGFNGRSHKTEDTCYSFWVGAPLAVLGWYDDVVDKENLVKFILSNYRKGQFTMHAGVKPDLMHTHFALCGLALTGYPGLESIHPALGFVQTNLPERVRTGRET
jgi:geranylgeranyl transferase type-1 subunit beta